MTDRETLRQTFGTVAATYQEARPDYPAEMYGDLLAVTGLPAGDRLLEVGCVTGIGEGLPPGARRPRPGELRSYEEEIAASGLFDVVHVRHFDWERRYDAEQYIALLDTFSGHILMADWQRERLDGAIRSGLAERPDRTLRRHWGAVLHIARRRDEVAEVR